MTNTNAPSGATPVNADGRPWEGALNEYYVPAGDTTALGIGDFVKLTTSAETDGTPHVTRAAATDTPVGVFMGLAAESLNAGGTIYRAASTATRVLVCDDPDAYFLMQEDSGGAALAAGDISLNIVISVGAVDTVTGRSQSLLDSSSVTASSDATPLKLVRKANIPGNDIGDYCKWIVKPNLHQRAHGTFGV